MLYSAKCVRESTVVVYFFSPMQLSLQENLLLQTLSVLCHIRSILLFFLPRWEIAEFFFGACGCGQKEAKIRSENINKEPQFWLIFLYPDILLRALQSLSFSNIFVGPSDEGVWNTRLLWRISFKGFFSWSKDFSYLLLPSLLHLQFLFYLSRKSLYGKFLFIQVCFCHSKCKSCWKKSRNSTCNLHIWTD